MTPTMGTMIGIPLTLLLIAWGARLTVRGSEFLAKEFDATPKITRRIGVGIMTATLVSFTFFWWPFNWAYHTWTPVSGQVASVDKRLLGQNKTMNEIFLITYRGNPQQYRCDDTRCAGVHPGDTLKLSCKPEWQYAATDGWVCNFVDAKAG